MRYLHGYGVIVPHAQKYKRIVTVAVAAVLILSLSAWFSGRASAVDNTETSVLIDSQQVLKLETDELAADCLETAYETNEESGTTTTCLVEVACDAVSVSSSSDLSNIIVLYQDNTYQQYTGSDFGTTQAWDIPQLLAGHGAIVGVWIYAGNNHYPPDELMAIFPTEFGDASSVGRYHAVTAVECSDEDLADNNVLSDNTTRPDPDKPAEGQVLAASTGGQVLAATGQQGLLSTLLGAFLLLASVLTLRFSRGK